MTRRQRSKRQTACPICDRRHNPGLPLTVPFGIPTTWSPTEALAIFEFVDQMRDLIAAVYGSQLTEAAARHQKPADQVPIPDGDRSF